MRFYYPQLLYIYLAYPLILAIIYFSSRFLKRKAGKIGPASSMNRLMRGLNRGAFRISLFLLLTGMGLAVAALARPQYPGGVEKIETTGGKIVVALDVSLSMLAEDFQPNRLEKAKREIVDLLDKLKAQSTGLVVFAGEAFVQCPPTVDYSAFRMFLDVAEVGIISDTGTDIADAINESVKLLDDGSPVDKAIVIFTDGETFEGDAGKAAEDARKRGIKLYAVGIGTTAGRPIPAGTAGRKDLKKDEEGGIVISRLNIDELTDIAEKGGGKFFIATPGEAEVNGIYADIRGLKGEETQKKYRTLYDEKYRWLLLPAVIMLAASMLVPTRMNHEV